MSYPRIDPNRIRVLPLARRTNLVNWQDVAVDPDAPPPDPGQSASQIDDVARAMRTARNHGAACILTYGAHAIKNGCGPLLIRLIDEGWLTHLATQGAGIIHDWEIAHLRKTSESVRQNAPVGEFGTWEETGQSILTAVMIGAASDCGFGESIGHFMMKNPARHPFADDSVTYRAYQRNIPLCVLPGIGYDIFCCHPMFTEDTGGAIGITATRDFHTFTDGVMNLTGGVYLSIGSAIMSPQCFEKAFSIANNLRESEGKPFLRDHTIAVVDLQPGGDWDFTSEQEPPADHPAYYLRWCKTFARMTAHHSDEAPGGTLDYMQCDNRVFLHNLYAQLRGA